MTGFIEHIRMETGGPREVLHRSEWSGTPPSHEAFREYASEALRGYFKNDGASLEPKEQFGVLRGGPPVAEAIVFVLADGTELHRYDLHDMMADNKEKTPPDAHRT